MADERGNARTRLRDNKKFQRRYLTWMRMMRYGINNFTRNAWLTTAATAVMTITLLIIFTTVVARTMLTETVTKLLREETKPSIYLKGDTPASEVSIIRQTLRKTPNVTDVEYKSSDDSRKEYITKDNITDTEELQTLAESDISFPIVFTMTLQDTDDLSPLQKLIKEDSTVVKNLAEDVDQLNQNTRGAVKKLTEWAQTSERVGIAATVVFVAISMLIIFNTIRMAIFNRRDEIDMMKLIGADKGFIRGPFVMEAVMYGFFAAVIASSLGYFALITFREPIASYGIAIDDMLNKLILFSPLVVLVMILLGAVIGIISSRLAVRRYLKV